MDIQIPSKFYFQIVNVSDVFYPGELCPCIFCSAKTSPINKTLNDSSAKLLCNLLNIKSSFASGFLLAPICYRCVETINSMIHVYNSIQALEIQLKLQKETILAYLNNGQIEITKRNESPCHNDKDFPADVFSASKFRKSIQTDLGISISGDDQRFETEITLATDRAPKSNHSIPSSDDVQHVDSSPFYNPDESDFNFSTEDVKSEEEAEKTPVRDEATAATNNIIKNCFVKLVRIQALDDAAKVISSTFLRSPQKTDFLASKFTKTSRRQCASFVVQSEKPAGQLGDVNEADNNWRDFCPSISSESKLVTIAEGEIRRREPFLCEHCGENFHHEKNYFYHKHKFHGISPPNFCCKGSCRMIFESANLLHEHEAYFHSSLECDKCGNILTGRQSLANHTKRYHSSKVTTAGIPVESRNAPSKQITINRAAQNISKIGNAPTVYTCETCNYHTTLKRNFIRHNDSLIHKLPPTTTHEVPVKGTFKCPEANCEFAAIRFFLLEQHLELVHGTRQEIEELHFHSKNDFETWKTNLQCTDNIKYTAMRSQPGFTRYYCNRTGCFKSTSKGVRKPKRLGSLKTGKTCPSRLLLKDLPDGTVIVKYHKTHVGHDKDPRRFGLTPEQKLEMAKSIAEGLTKDEVIKKFRSSCANNKNQRGHFISKPDLRNNINSFLPKLDKSISDK